MPGTHLPLVGRWRHLEVRVEIVEVVEEVLEVVAHDVEQLVELVVLRRKVEAGRQGPYGHWETG